MMIKRFFSYLGLILFLISILSSHGCRSSLSSDPIEGMVVYEVSYPDTIKNGPMASFLPKEMTLYFNHNKTNAEFKMGMGLITTRFLSDSEEKKFSTIFKGFGKKTAMVFNEEEVNKNFLDRVNLKIVETGNIKDIAGFKCREVNITDSTENSYLAYYTEDVNIENPNWCTPYREIDGLMLEYSVKVNNMVMNLKARKVVFEKVDSILFTVPQDYEIITDPKQFKIF